MKKIVAVLFVVFFLFFLDANASFYIPNENDEEDSPMEDIYMIVKAFTSISRVGTIPPGDNLTYMSNEEVVFRLTNGKSCTKILIKYVDTDNDGWGNGDRISYIYRFDDQDIYFLDFQENGEMYSCVKYIDIYINTKKDESFNRLHDMFRKISYEIIIEELKSSPAGVD